MSSQDVWTDPQPAPPPVPRPLPAPPPQAWSPAEIGAAFSRPIKVIDLVLASPERVAMNLERKHSLGPLTGVFLIAASFFAVPYGCVLGWDSWWRVIVFYLGSTAICLPSLYVFATYLGARASLAQIAILALSIPAVAALFTFGFAPILGFLRLTMSAGASEISWLSISRALLTFAALAGVAQLWRCLIAWMRTQAQVLFVLVLLAWHVVFAYVLLRMASVLGLGR